MSAISQRPGVYSRHTVSLAAGRAVPQGAALVAAKGSAEEKGRLDGFSSLAALKEWEGFREDSPCHRAGALLLEQGVGKVYLFTVEEDYTPSVKAAESLWDIGAVVTDCVHGGTLRQFAQEERELSGGQLGRVVFSGTQTVEDSLRLAEETASSRCCLCYPPMEKEGEAKALYTAAAFAARVLALESPAYTLNWMELEGVDCPASPAEEEINRLILGGVTPFENWQGKAQCVRAVTTGVKAEQGLKSLNTLLIVDHVMAYLRENLTLLLKNSRGKALGAQAIASQAAVLLGNKQDEGLLTSFEPPTAAASPEDPTVCALRVGFQAATVVDIIRIDAVIRI